MKDEPNKITATLKVVVTGELYGDEASEETLRYFVEQDLEDDGGFDVDVELLKEQEPLAVDEGKLNKCVCGNEINRYWHPEYCGFCGKKLEWY